MTRRYDMYRDVHKGLRSELAALLVQAGSLDPRDRVGVSRTFARWKKLQLLLEAYRRVEDVYLGPHIRRVAPELFAEMERDRDSLEAAVADLAHSASALAMMCDYDSARAFYLDLALFVGRCFVHMDREERVYMRALQDAYDDQELAAIGDTLRASLEPTLLATFYSLMFPAMNPEERERLSATVGKLRYA